jgi:NAD+ synthase (glutamine-hydrolysing)
MRTLRLGLAQINPVVGDLEGNFKKIVRFIDKAKKMGVQLIAFPELCITGYPPEDLLLKPGFIDKNLKQLRRLIDHCENITVIIGFVARDDDIFNAAAVLHHKKLAGVYRKVFLPNYGVFDENRYFQSGQEVQVYNLNDICIGVNICEDIWYPGGPTKDQALYGGAEVIINISASPYHYGKARDRYRMISTRAEDNVVIIAYVNTVGGQDELVFDGNSMVISEQGELLSKSPSFQEHLLTVTLHPDKVFSKRIHDPRRRKEKLYSKTDRQLSRISLDRLDVIPKSKPPESGITEFLDLSQEVYKALMTGLFDYVEKNNFKKVVIGISGGIDSALVTAIAVDALGKENVIGVSMPSEFTSQPSKEDAEILARNFEITFYEIPLTVLYQAFLQELAAIFSDRAPDITEENIQARIRGNILMSLSNKFGWLVLATGNKSEISVGYCTLYGDMVGGFSVIKDVYKTIVYELANYRNTVAGYDIIPERIIKKEPSAELKPDQKDTDSLPEYQILDPILRAYVEQDQSADEIASMGYDLKIVKKVMQMVDSNEYKRRQAAPGIKITHRAFGKDRRFPITNHFNK